MATIYPTTFDGQNNIERGTKVVKRSGESDLATILRDAAGDLANSSTDLGLILQALQALSDKLDLDAGVSDTDYRATLDGIITVVASASPSTIAG
jgi:hypothetical protein